MRSSCTIQLAHLGQNTAGRGEMLARQAKFV